MTVCGVDYHPLRISQHSHLEEPVYVGLPHVLEVSSICCDPGSDNARVQGNESGLPCRASVPNEAAAAKWVTLNDVDDGTVVVGCEARVDGY